MVGEKEAREVAVAQLCPSAAFHHRHTDGHLHRFLSSFVRSHLCAEY